MAEPDRSQVRVFVSYSHKDKRWLDRLRVHLAPLIRDFAIDLWDDTRLRAGSKWQEEIRNAVDNANAAVLIISADFLASDFVRTNELPPLLKAAEEEGCLILSIIASHSLFSRYPELSQFQAVNNPSQPLVQSSEGEQEATFLRVAEELFEIATATPAQHAHETEAKEAFLEHRTWSRLIKIGDWIFDEDEGRIMGSGVRTYLLSRDEYGESPFRIVAKLEFSNFKLPGENKLGMNSGIIFGWKVEKESHRYFNILVTGSDLLVERIGFKGGGDTSDFEHITERVPLSIESGKTYTFEVKFDESRIEIDVNGKPVQSLNRPTGVVGRVGLRPWRSIMECTMFVVGA